MDPFFYVFCIWIWVLTILSWYNIISFTPLYLSILALSFTIPFHIFYNNSSLTHSFLITIVEAAVLLLNVHIHFFVRKKPFFVFDDIEISVILFGVYLLFLRCINKSFYEVYFVDIPNKHT